MKIKNVVTTAKNLAANAVTFDFASSDSAARHAHQWAHNFVGVYYYRDRSIKEVVYLVGAEIESAVKAGTLPAGLKASVNAGRHPIDQDRCMITVTITECPGMIVNPLRLADDIVRPRGKVTQHPLTEGAIAVLDAMHAIVDSYNYDGGNSAADFAGELKDAQRAEIEAALMLAAA